MAVGGGLYVGSGVMVVEACLGGGFGRGQSGIGTGFEAGEGALKHGGLEGKGKELRGAGG